MSLHVIATVVAHADHSQQVANALQELARHTRTEPGNRRYDLYRDNADTNIFHLLETYEDETALETHRHSGHFISYQTRIQGCLAEPTRVHVLTALDEQSATR